MLTPALQSSAAVQRITLSQNSLRSTIDDFYKHRRIAARRGGHLLFRENTLFQDFNAPFFFLSKGNWGEGNKGKQCTYASRRIGIDHLEKSGIDFRLIFSARTRKQRIVTGLIPCVSFSRRGERLGLPVFFLFCFALAVFVSSKSKLENELSIRPAKEPSSLPPGPNPRIVFSGDKENESLVVKKKKKNEGKKEMERNYDGE